jgi:hypothetical protein
MFTSTTRIRLLTLALVAACSIGGQAIARPIESLSLNFEKVTFDYRLGDDGVPFGIELTINPDGSVDGVLPAMSHYSKVTLKRGVFQSGAPAGNLVELQYVDGPQFRVVGSMAVESIDAANFSLGLLQGGVAGMSAGADTVACHMDRSSFGGLIQLVFTGGDGARLTGFPREIVGPGGTGKTLSANLLAPAHGETLNLTVKVVDQNGAAIQLPIRIQHRQ